MFDLSMELCLISVERSEDVSTTILFGVHRLFFPSFFFLFAFVRLDCVKRKQVKKKRENSLCARLTDVPYCATRTDEN